MNNFDIHQGLDKADVRDVISKTFVDTYDKGNLEYTFYGESQLNQAKEKLRIAQQNLEAVKTYEAFVIIMKTFGWEEFDVSDETILEANHKYYMCFIGTQEEYEELLKRIENEKE